MSGRSIFCLAFLIAMLCSCDGSQGLHAATDPGPAPVQPEKLEDDQPERDTAAPLVRAKYIPELLGNIASPSLKEASGLALSTRLPELLWAHNDSGYGPYLFVLTLQGKDLGRFYLENTGSGDWEDMAAFKWRDQSWLMVADTGDNNSKKPSYSLYLLAEPEVSPTRKLGVRPLRGVRRARIKYPGGPADTEAVAVDPIEERVYLITKRQRPARVFSLPLSAFDDSDTVHQARFETSLYPLPAPTLQELVEHPDLGLAFAQPNALDFAPDRSFALVHTYGYSYRFTRTPQQSWAQALSVAPSQISVPSMKQAEAVAIGWDNLSLYYTSEGKNPPLYRLVPAAPVISK